MPMIKTSTENELIRFLYKESSQNKQIEINRALIEDEDLQEDLFSFNALIEKLNKITINAPQRAINKILAYARQSNMESA